MFKTRTLLILLCLLLIAIPVFAQDSAELEYTVNLSSNDNGQFLVGANGMTLYTFGRDALDTSNCSGQCLENWPALTVESADALTADAAIPGEWGTITRDDGALQVTYNGQPLYNWSRDTNPGDTTGEGVGGVWWIVPPATVYISHSDDLGKFLVGPTGMTVYMFTNDTQDAGTSACSGDCATNWPALTVESADAIVAGDNVRGELGTIEREDGALQVTYNGWPLYYFANDAARGDTNGEGAGERWYTIAPETVVVSSGEPGDFLVANLGGKTLYTFNNDAAGVSNCSGDCATAWPPLTVGASDRLVAGAGAAGELATIEREDGALQVTYNGMPLYFFQNDLAPGDINGQGVGDVWFVAAP